MAQRCPIPIIFNRLMKKTKNIRSLSYLNQDNFFQTGVRRFLKRVYQRCFAFCLKFLTLFFSANFPQAQFIPILLTS